MTSFEASLEDIANTESTFEPIRQNDVPLAEPSSELGNESNIELNTSSSARSLSSALVKKFNSLSRLIGNTPMLAVKLKYKGQARTLYAKAEYYNFTGSIKDRMALNILRRAYQMGALKEGDTIVEATSGNAGIAMAAVGRALGHKVKIFMPDWMSQERMSLLRAYGADLVLVTREEGGFIGAIEATQTMAKLRDDVFLPRQFSNHCNVHAHCYSTGPEIVHQLASVRQSPDAFVAGVGTGGTIMGVSHALAKACPKTKCFAMEPAESPTLSTGFKVGAHRIQGVSDDFIPDIVALDDLDGVISVNDGDGIIMAQRLASELGLGVGISSGANLIAALKVQNRLAENACVATIFCDDNKKYLSTALGKDEPTRAGYLSQDIELLGFEAIASSSFIARQ